jgi:hypothetical protein
MYPMFWPSYQYTARYSEAGRARGGICHVKIDPLHPRAVSPRDAAVVDALHIYTINHSCAKHALQGSGRHGIQIAICSEDLSIDGLHADAGEAEAE